MAETECFGHGETGVCNMEIDFVIPWVDGSDPQWVSVRNQYSNNPISEAQYRDWDILKYWFRAVEKYAPWVRRIHFVTFNQVPQWLNKDHEKLHLVDHKDYIPEEYLPTFSSHAIELNFHRIEGLAEHFVYFNDDMFLGAPVKETDFFVDGKPCESPIMSAMTPSVVGDPFVHYLCNNLSVINAHFPKRATLKGYFKKWFAPCYGKLLLKNFYYGILGKFTGFQNFHLPSSMLKSNFEEVWNLEPELLQNTCSHKFRSREDVNQYVMSQYNICKGNFTPRKPNIGKFFTIGANSEEMYRSLRTGRYKLLCLNDNVEAIDFEGEKQKLVEIFEEIFPQKSSFEL